MESVSTGSFATPPFHHARGCWLYDAGGTAYFDGTAGSGALNLGHNPPRVAEAVREQLDLLTHTGCKLGSDVRARWVEKLCGLAPFEPCAALPAVIGTEAVESALKIARAHSGRRSVVAFRHAFHGKSSGSLSVTWREQLRRYSSLNPDDVFRASYPPMEEIGSEEAVDAHLDLFRQVLEHAADAGRPPAAVILEPIQVTEGVLLAGPRFLEGVIRAARDAGALVLFDEIYTGFGRCGELFYCKKLSLLPDLLVVGKSLGNGFPISAVLGPPDIVNALPAGVQTSTYTGHPLACAASIRVMDVILETRLWERAARLGGSLLAGLRSMAAEHGFLAGARGEGLLLAFDCVDPSGRPEPAFARSFLAEAQRRRLLLFGGGVDGATVKIVPPVLMDEGDVSFLTTTLAETAEALRKTPEIRDAFR